MSKDAVETGNSPTTKVVDCVGASLRIKGQISGSEDLLVEGTVEGPIHLVDHKLTVGLGAKLNSEVVAREVIIHGTTARILIEDGANFRGSIEIDRKAPATGSDTTLQARAATATGQSQSGKPT